MQRDNLTDLNAFLIVAEEGSFTRAAARLGTSQSALSHTLRRLETRLGVRLLSRTTRSLSPTEAGERLLARLRPALDEIDAGIAAIGELRDKPAGTIRITSGEHAAGSILWPALMRLLPDYPDIRIEVSIDAGLADIVADRFDAGIRLGESVAKDMIAVPISGEMSMATIAAPAYLAAHGVPQTPHDLAHHSCINLRFPTRGSLYAWEYEKDGRELNVRVDGQLTFNNTPMLITATIAGFGIAHTIADIVRPELAAGTLVRVLEDWCPPFAGYHLYYPSRRQHSAAFALLLAELRRPVLR